ncbi:hypothetical protein J6590_065751 [Homalodisca vitripennis]|nr:hypothetical protein J6590_065751 [Homalodisca vitripennis]
MLFHLGLGEVRNWTDGTNFQSEWDSRGSFTLPHLKSGIFDSLHIVERASSTLYLSLSSSSSQFALSSSYINMLPLLILLSIVSREVLLVTFYVSSDWNRQAGGYVDRGSQALRRLPLPNHNLTESLK